MTTTTTKKTKKAARHATLTPMTYGKRCLWLTQDGATTGYVLTAIPSQIGGQGYRLGKASQDGCSEEYDCLIDMKDGFHQCECRGFLRWNHCKHCESLVALSKAGKL